MRSSSRSVSALLVTCLSLACDTADTDVGDPPTSTLEGRLVVYGATFKNGSTGLDYGLRRPGSPEVKLELATAPPFAPGTPIKVDGSFDGNGRFVAASIARATGNPQLETVTSAIIQPTQTRSIAVIHLLPSNEPEPAPFVVGPELARNSLFGTEFLPDLPATSRNADAFYREVSYGARGLEGTVFDWITIDPLVDNCDLDVLRNLAEAAASANGINLTAFQHVAIVVAAGCANFGGRAEVGTPNAPGRYSWYWFEGGAGIFVHELAHNFGMLHANTYTCTSASGQEVPLATPDRCTEQAVFGQDPWDPMGSSFAHFGAYNKMLEGWLAGTNVVTAGASGGDFTLDPIELGTSAPQLLRVPVDTSLCPVDIVPCFYYVEYRQPIGFDGVPQFINSQMHQGALIRIGGEIDTTGNSAGNLTRLFKIHPPAAADTLKVGETFEDPTGLRITTVATPTAGDHEQLVVSVSRASRIAATFTFSSGGSGTTGSYCGDVRITNVSSTNVDGGWLVRLNLNQSELTTGWNGTFTSLGGSLYDLTPVPWNSVIGPGQTITAGMCANKTGANFTPQVVFTQSN